MLEPPESVDRYNEPVATASPPTTPSNARYTNTGVLLRKVFDSENQKLIGGAKFEIDGGPNRIQWMMPDNNAGDIDLKHSVRRLGALSGARSSRPSVHWPNEWRRVMVPCLAVALTLDEIYRRVELPAVGEPDPAGYAVE